MVSMRRIDRVPAARTAGPSALAVGMLPRFVGRALAAKAGECEDRLVERQEELAVRQRNRAQQHVRTSARFFSSPLI